jgi:uroporphyrinogen-III synthase
VIHRGHDCAAPPPGSTGGGEALARLLLEEVGDHTVLFPCALERHGALEANYEPIMALPVYRKARIEGVEIPKAHQYVVTSPSAVAALADAWPEGRYLALGETTAGAMSAAGLAPHAVAESPTSQALVKLILKSC